MNKFYIKTFGCQMNEYDSYIISKVLQSKGNMIESYSLVNANVLILNTCSVREKANGKFLSELGMWRKFKDLNESIIICVGGCVASLEGNNILTKFPFVDIVFGPQSLDKLYEMICEVRLRKVKIINNCFSGLSKFNNVYLIDDIHGVSSYLTIMEGCNKYCTYCIVPYSRGYEKSRSFNSVISEIYLLVMQGVKEIVLLGQNVSSYNGLVYDNTFANLSLLIDYANNIDELCRIKFITSNPIDFNDNLMSSYLRNEKLSDHLHLPLQSGSNKILNLMKRGYSIEEYKDIILKLRKIRSNITISTDIIVGFPGETLEDFENTLKFISDIGFDMSFTYIYSPRPNTLAYDMKDNVTFNEKKRRLKILNDILLKQSCFITDSMVGTVQRVLFYKFDEDKLIGKTDNNRTVFSLGNVDHIGKLCNVFIKGKKNINLYGNLI